MAKRCAFCESSYPVRVGCCRCRHNRILCTLARLLFCLTCLSCAWTLRRDASRVITVADQWHCIHVTTLMRLCRHNAVCYWLSARVGVRRFRLLGVLSARCSRQMSPWTWQTFRAWRFTVASLLLVQGDLLQDRPQLTRRGHSRCRLQVSPARPTLRSSLSLHPRVCRLWTQTSNATSPRVLEPWVLPRRFGL